MSIHHVDVPEVVRRVLEPVDRLDAQGFAAGLTEDASMRLGNREPLHGRAEIASVIGQFFSSLAGIHHDIVASWDFEDVVVTELFVTYDRLDGRSVTTPSATIWRFDDASGLVRDYRVFVDQSPLLAP